MGLTATILSPEEVAKLPQSERPICYRITSKMYHDVWEAVGHASLCWNPRPDNQVFDTSEAEKCAMDLCFKLAGELERIGVPPESITGK